MGNKRDKHEAGTSHYHPPVTLLSLKYFYLPLIHIACADRDLTSLWAQCRSCCDQTVHWARAGQTEIGGLDQMVIGVNIHWTDSGLTHFEINI